MIKNFMKIREVGYRGKTAIIAGTSAAMFGGSEIAERIGETSDYIGIINDLGKVGLAWSGFRVVKIGIAKLGENVLKNREAEREELMARLPDLKDPVSSLRITLAVDKRLKEKPYITGMTTAFSASRLAAETCVNEGDNIAYSALAEDVDYIIEQMAEAERTPAAGPDDFRYMLAHRAALLLDEVAPIHDDCTKTPQTADEGRYWYDFIQDQALSRNEARFEAESAWL